MENITPLEKYKEIRENTKLSQAKFAEKFGVKVHQIKELDLGRQKSIPDNLATTLEKEYGIPFKWWKTGQGPDTINQPTAEEIKNHQDMLSELAEKLQVHPKQAAKFLMVITQKPEIVHYIVRATEGDQEAADDLCNILKKYQKT